MEARPRRALAGLTGGLLGGLGLWLGAQAQQPAPPPMAPSEDALEEIKVQVWEPRYVSPTRRDRIGRIWAPVFINGQGPFRLVLDSGANRSGITGSVAQQLALPENPRPVLLHGVTGSITVPTVRAERLQIGDLWLGPADLPVLLDPLGGADGILGTDRLLNRRIYVDFRGDRISIERSHSEPAPPGFLTVPFRLTRGNLLSVEASVGGIAVTAIIDTGGQISVANQALLRALEQRRHKLLETHPDQVIGVTSEAQAAETGAVPPISIRTRGLDNTLTIRAGVLAFGDMRIFEHWRLTSQPALLVGMDALGLLDTLIIDYQRRELQVRTHSTP